MGGKVCRLQKTVEKESVMEWCESHKARGRNLKVYNSRKRRCGKTDMTPQRSCSRSEEGVFRWSYSH